MKYQPKKQLEIVDADVSHYKVTYASGLCVTMRADELEANYEPVQSEPVVKAYIIEYRYFSDFPSESSPGWKRSANKDTEGIFNSFAKAYAAAKAEQNKMGVGYEYRAVPLT